MSPDGLILEYRLRTVKTGVQATFLVLAGLALYPVVAGRTVHTAPYVVLLAVTGAGAAVIAKLPWRRLFVAGHGLRLMYIWSVLDILIITALIPVTGGARSEFFWLYTLTAFFMASSYRPRAQVMLLAFTYLSYTGVLVATGEPIPADALLHRFSVLAVLVFMASFLARELIRRVELQTQAREESERRARLLGAVAHAARAMNRLDSDHVLGAVVEATVDLGLDASMLCVLDPDRTTYRVPHARGVPEAYQAGTYETSTGITSLVLERRETVLVPDYANHPLAIPSLREAGFRAGLAVPVWAQGEIAAVLACGAKGTFAFTPEELESIELLAGLAGRALENARLFEEERRTVERLAELDEMKKDFLSNVSHELRTPLTVISGMGVTLEQRWELLTEDKRKEFIRRLNANARALDDVIKTLLDFTQLDAGRIEIRPEQIAVGPMLRQIAARIGPLFSGHELAVEVEGPVVAEADPRLLERVIENLLSNAAKYTPQGTRVALSARPEGADVVVAVADEGPGIPPGELRHLGERFYRGGDTNTRHTRGTGLGLAFVSEVLRLHGSVLRIESEVGRGSRFSFRLPAAVPSLEQPRFADRGGSSDRGGMGSPPGPSPESPGGPPPNRDSRYPRLRET